MKYEVRFKDYLKDINDNDVECENSFYVDAVCYVQAMQKGCRHIRHMFRSLPDHLDTIHDLEVKELSLWKK